MVVVPAAAPTSTTTTITTTSTSKDSTVAMEFSGPTGATGRPVRGNVVALEGAAVVADERWRSTSLA